jgi:hypothetical protein
MRGLAASTASPEVTVSIAAMADSRVQRTEAQNPSVKGTTTKAGIPAGILNTIVGWVPTETLGLYVGVQAVLPELKVKPNAAPCTADYTDRWVLFISLLLVSLVLVPIYTLIKCRGSATGAGQTAFKMPVLEMGLTGLAFALWAFSLPDSPFDTYCDVKEWHSTLALGIGGILLGGVALALKRKPDWSETKTTNSPPAPDVP